MDINFRVADRSDISKIARIHIQCFRATFIASFGHYLITKYYEEFYKENPLFVIAEENREIVGFCMGYCKGSVARKNFIHNNKFRLVFRMAFLFLCINKLAISKCMSYLKPKKQMKEEVKSTAGGDLLSICVVDMYKGQGVAKNLVIEFEKLLRSKGISDYTLSVYKSNLRAIRFYEKCGLIFYEDRGDEIKMYKKINR